ncbi:MAG: hypothetical protein M0Z61_00860 [Nitrospiraceae bacterium]|nr:hypothetical protein [Nitrospiraceae bacterium]
MDFLKKISRAMYGIIIICFFLPFTTASCSGQKILTLTGFQMVTGTTVRQPNMFGQQTKQKKIGTEPYAIAGFILAFIGLAISFSRNKTAYLFSAFISASGAVCLLLLKTKLDRDVLNSGQGLILLDYDFGYWVSFIIFILSAVLNGHIHKQFAQKKQA